jgi:hypothetical protein
VIGALDPRDDRQAQLIVFPSGGARSQGSWHTGR